MKDNEKKLFAIFILALMIGTLIASLSLRTPATHITPERPREFITMVRENVAVSDTPEPNNEPSIAVDPEDPEHIVAAGNDYGTPNGDAWVGYHVSWDGGETWSRDLIPGYLLGPISPLTGYDGAGDPVVMFGPEGNVYIAGICFKRANNPAGFGIELGRADGIFVAKSTDGGVTFNQITMVATALQTLITFHDKEWMAVDMNNGNVYVMWAAFTGLVMANILFSRSTDGGDSFSVPQIASPLMQRQFNNQGSTLQVDPDGKIHAFWIEFGIEAVQYIYSTDEGQSFSSPQSIADVVEIPRTMEGNNYRTPTLLMSAVDLSDTNTSGNVYVTWNDYRHGDADIMLIYTHDGGATWSEPIRVNDDEEENGLDQFFPAVAVSYQGIVHIFFYDRRDDPDNTLIRSYYAQSHDGGQNFTANINISDEPFDGNNAPHAFIGDYSGMSAHNNSAYAIWCDCREGTPENGDSELYFTRIDFGYSDDEIFSEDEE
jgi:hypothetical protein